MEEVLESIVDGVAAAGYAVTDRLLAPELAARLRANAEARIAQGQFRKAGIGKGEDFQRNASIRTDQILWLEPETADPAERAFLHTMETLIRYLNRTCYTGLRGYEFHYAWYAKGSFYRRHLDRFRSDDARRYSVVCYLNPEWAVGDGGELVLFRPEGERVVEPRLGTVVVFESGAVEHEVRLAHKDRYSVTGWLK